MSTTSPALRLRRPLGGAPERAALARRLPAVGLGALAALALAAFLALPTYPTYDSLYALVWAREILDGQLPGFDAYRAPTQHPLLLPVALVLAPLGDLGARLWVLACIVALLALLVAAWRLGRLVAGPLGAVTAAGLVGSRLDFAFLAALGFLDVAYCALLMWAMVLEVERPRRGGPVWQLLALAGLLRPEAWLLAGAYGLWLGRGARVARRLRALAPAAVAPGVWALIDLAVTGDPLFSIHHTDALAAELHRELPLAELPQKLVFLLLEIVKPPLLAVGLVGGVLALRLRRRELALPAAVAVLAAASWMVIATGGLATVYRYLLPTALGVSLLATFALAGWTWLPRGTPWRGRWAALAGLACVLGAGWTAARLDPGKIHADLAERRAIRAELARVLADPDVAAARRCGPVTVPNHKLVPEVRWLLEAPDRAVRARSDRRTARALGGVAIVIAPALEERPGLNVYEVPDDGSGILAAPASFELLAAGSRFGAWGACTA